MHTTSRLPVIAAATLSLAFGFAPAAHAGVPDLPDDTAQAAGGVFDIAKAGDRLILGGRFTRFGGRARVNVAAVGSDGKVDTTFDAPTNGDVNAVAVSQDGSTVFLGGMFTQVAGTPRANLAAVDAVTGAVIDAWRADTGGTYPNVNSLAVSGDRLYVGGRFTAIDGTTRKRLVALDATTGDLVREFNPAPSGVVREVVVSPDGSLVYAGGGFGKIGGQLRAAHSAELLATTGDATAFDPQSVDGGSHVVTVEITPDGSRFFHSTENNHVVAYDLSANTPVWKRKLSGNTQAMKASASGELYLGGHFSQDLTSGLKRPSFASVHWDDGELTSWNPNASGGKWGVWAFVIDGAHLHAGGFFRYFDGILQRGYARFTGTP